MRATWSARNISIVDHAERFARVMNGAALLYNLMLAERAAELQGAERGRWHDLVKQYRDGLDAWEKKVSASLAYGWSLAGLWSLTSQTIHSVAPQTMDFVTTWANLVQRGQPLVDDPAARALILRRETRLKGPKARLTNDAALARWGGASGAAMIAYRWPVVRRHLRDLANAV